MQKTFLWRGIKTKQQTEKSLTHKTNGKKCDFYFYIRLVEIGAMNV